MDAGAHAADAPDLHVRLRAEPHVRRAIELLYHLGQLAADPHLATAAIVPAVLPPSPPPAPGILARLGRALPPPPAEPEELAHRDLSVRDVNGVEVRPNARIKHEHHGLGTYLGIGSRGSTLMRREDGVVVAFTDQDFRRIYEIGSGRRD
ncbi:MAG TPA: hypothetical protein VFJ82_25275 [Longimicrobium sp.]|nr:hypothetical protein [Longimicrobium sp.]